MVRRPFDRSVFVGVLEMVGEAEVRERLGAGQFDRKPEHLLTIREWLAAKQRQREERRRLLEAAKRLLELLE